MSGLEIGQWVFNGMITIILAYVARKNHQIDRLQDQIKKDAEKYLQDRFTTIGREMAGHLEPVIKSIDEIGVKLKDGEKEFDGLSDRDHQIELKLSDKLATLQAWMTQHFAGREEQRETCQRVQKMSEDLARLKAQIERRIERD